MKISLKYLFLLITLSSGQLLAQSTARPSFKFDFGSSDVQSGYTAVTPKSTYTDASGFGFDYETLPAFADSGKGNALKRDFVTASQPFYFSVKLPEGNYKVRVLLGNSDGASKTTVKAESRRLMLQNISPAKGKFRYETFIVNIKDRNISENKKVALKPREYTKLDWDNKLTLEFAVQPCVAAIEITPVDDQITVFLAGNSTVVNQDDEPWASWGQMIPYFFKPGIAIANHAESGLTLGSFMGSKRLEKILSVMKKGDYLFIEFGHNDQKDKGANDGAYKSYTENLKFFVSSFRAKGGIPVIVTSTARRSFSNQGDVVETLGDFPDAARKVAAELNVPLIDLNKETKILYKALGVEPSKKALVHYPANSYPGQTQALADNTHFNPYGAYQISKIITQGIIDQKIKLKKYIRNFDHYDAEKPDPFTSWTWPESLRSDAVKPDGN
ncbi:rhamnogalacturonan acetylesterase [Pedobacter cryophilus]|uniref:Rhamnogalacturonan acetylesterase n=1 Tax=Pedobacter cryophilus TaxID=2571271 RepID=A0A4V5NWT4_9SPHI|nr:rhamnogalacturonan acetylesterase [Pedobacter cryophilus]TKB96233.1 rhamnogalacturonan acetylesterase [Pedobacter cryophilus]